MTKFSISKSTLLNRIQAISKIIPSRVSMPIMSTILFQYEDGSLRLTAVDNSGQINTTLGDIECNSNFSICYDSKRLIDALKTLPEQPLSFEINTETLTTGKSYPNYPPSSHLK